MKKLTLFFLLGLFSTVLHAQDKKFSIGLGPGVSITNFKSGVDKSKGTGFNYFFNAFYKITPRISGGIEYEWVGVDLKFDYPPYDAAEIERTTITNISIKGFYHFGNNDLRPYVGCGAGYYTVNPGKASFPNPLPNGPEKIVIEAETKSAGGFAPEVGLNYKGFHVAALYHVVAGVDTSFSNDLITYTNLEFRASYNIYFGF
ncbi:porin family protein [Flammeovirga yaeyamensis]|uniref:Porin family protein n=1 Tax=Flammeovirga yaeyamensis TaxID=367791 RepID=A0AAX1N856_9BACT|nr:outer membrane beta-barrel protein [Flammeovirga yaeyamensis]MBB3698883.1 hypothetical protein [Flammeovirga yaeyamensis]NMF37467.1 porin family protein [Flammeovirga yaeyamensis]QWG03720.1 porin family protein [Flammeovirga yaeyamensis]